MPQALRASKANAELGTQLGNRRCMTFTPNSSGIQLPRGSDFRNGSCTVPYPLIQCARMAIVRTRRCGSKSPDRAWLCEERQVTKYTQSSKYYYNALRFLISR